MNGISIHGTVRAPEGSGPAATVTLISPQGRQLGRALTGADGRFELSAPEPGAYVLIAAAEGHRPQATAVIAGGEQVTHDIVLAGNGGLSGVVRAEAGGQPVSGAIVVVTDPSGEVLATAKTGTNGDFAFGELPDGTFTVAVNAAGYRPTALPVETGARGTGRLEVALSAGARLQGTVRGGPDHRPMRDARVTLVDADGDVAATATTGEDGRYVFTDLPAGDYTLIASGYPPATTPVGLHGPGGGGYDIRLGHPDE
ncbi:MSCRAMM family protein [Streptantibioticus silvisoli]|jgi:uncharacterized protein YfaS (alpha-2-macroglobulin family)|uniref:Carboxypeptidase-like regulatory domain-containing protein n=1 Tax=Streptantibioticus silvisoli TaxID=2705255 RepID=A0ABT6W6U9_9ACTN|nr:carboxypeptidase-like regulatory domain-containing protein [Streptantibioticus silvisoli]MDI5965687.1 carboxypeptidase-like regulatory domain-containing protein [Streptantibioticus silvisoli]